MKNIPRTFLLLAGLFLAVMPANQATAQSQYSSSPTDALSLWQARRAVIAASKEVDVYVVNPKSSKFRSSSIVLTLDSIEFDATFNASTKKSYTKHILIDLKDIKRATAKCYDDYSGCWLTTESGTEYTIQDKDEEAVRYGFHFRGDTCNGHVVNNTECMHLVDWFARALNSLHAFALSHPAGLGDFHAQATAWRALTTKPALAENARILRLAAEDAIKRQKPDEALNDFELGVQADPTWAQGWFNAALLAGELGFFADAADHMQNYLELLPDASDAQSARDQIDLWKYKAGQSPLTAQPAGAPNKK
jgi:tetratricopeptide (TPR) repeat protein